MTPTIEEIESLRRCLLQIEQKFGMGSHLNWTESVYKVLSDHITTASKRTVSTNTLRRLYDKVVKGNGDYLPKVETKNALAIYLGYEDWYHFYISADNHHSVEKANQPERITAENDIDVPLAKPIVQDQTKISHEPNNSPINKRKGGKQPVFYLLGIILFTIAALYWMNKPKGQQVEKFARLVRLSNPATGVYPFSQEYKVEYAGYRTDSLTVDSYEGFIGSVMSTNNYFSVRYFAPGIYVVRLKNAGTTVDLDTSIVKSRGWERIINTTQAAFQYPENFTMSQAMRLSETDLKDISLRLKHRLRTEYLNYGNLNFNPEDFVIEARLKNTPLVSDMDCYASKLKVVAEGGNLILCLSKKGCGQQIYCEFSEKIIAGNRVPQEKLAVMDKDWVDIKMQAQGKAIKAWINGSLVLETTYSRPVGKLVGQTFSFEGDGRLSFVKVSDNKGKLFAEQRFDPSTPTKP